MRCFSCDYQSQKPRSVCPRCQEPMGNVRAELEAAEADYARDEARQAEEDRRYLENRRSWKTCGHTECRRNELEGLDHGCLYGDWK